MDKRGSGEASYRVPLGRAAIRVDAYAKVNFGLRIGGRRDDGFHPILSVFQSVSLCDSLYISVGEGRGISVTGEFDCRAEDTTIFRAAQLYSEASGSVRAIRIHVEKRIPARAGLGGGSSDAAAVLMALESLFDRPLGMERLVRMGASIGSDVPFFLASGAAVVSGRGEAVDAILPRTDFAILLVKPEFGVSTAWAYGALDRSRLSAEKLSFQGSERETQRLAALWAEQYRSEISNWNFKNDFAGILYREHPVYSRIEDALRKNGALFVSVSGSGSSIYGIFGSGEQARSAMAALSSASARAEAGIPLPGNTLHLLEPLETCLVLR